MLKADLLRRALSAGHASALYLDCDVLLLAPLPPMGAAPLGLSRRRVNAAAPSGPHLITTQSAAHPGREKSALATLRGSNASSPPPEVGSLSADDAPTAVPAPAAPCPAPASSP